MGSERLDALASHGAHAMAPAGGVKKVQAAQHTAAMYQITSPSPKSQPDLGTPQLGVQTIWNVRQGL
jgi:hypothetical protein